MKLVTYDAIMEWNPCYNPIQIGIPTDYSDTLLNFVKEYRHKVKNLQDINWITCRFLDKKTRDYYTWWCVNEIKHLMKDKRSVKAINILKDYIDGVATIKELKAAVNAADAAYVEDDAAYCPFYAANAAVEAAKAAVAVDVDVDVAVAVDVAVYLAAKVAAVDADVAAAWDGAIAVYDIYSNLQIDKLIEILESK
jgi:hypothetical protein